MFLYPNTPNFTRHIKFLGLTLYLLFKENEIIFNIPNFCHPVYYHIFVWLLFTMLNLRFIGVSADQRKETAMTQTAATLWGKIATLFPFATYVSSYILHVGIRHILYKKV